MANNFLNLYDTLPEIGRGSFGVVRRVRRKSDGMIFARKELNFQRMSPKDRKQIAAECAIWDYFLQILLALDHCHNTEGNVAREQIVHRDLKPENVFLDGANSVKVGDFGLSKALVQDGFANTYVGTPHYMSPELMQGKAYNSKSDIWSLGCLIYELCSLKPPFNEAKNSGRARGFDTAMIKTMLHPNVGLIFLTGLATLTPCVNICQPAMRPSVAQLLKHERIKFALMVSEREKRYVVPSRLP
ncbi:kinase-like domain-containing protein [Mycena olivaceomarginata]|nr:kinase-like domain-containing protein [Mycena olivaceomarginata]